jgi:hypothetical protein
MDAGMIFVLFLAAGFLIFVGWLAALSRRNRSTGDREYQRSTDRKSA